MPNSTDHSRDSGESRYESPYKKLCVHTITTKPWSIEVAMDKFAELPSDTKVYCGHEYTMSNCEFALQVEPENEALQARYAEAQQLRANGEITLPSTLSSEFASNPFMRTREASVVKAAQERRPDSKPGAETLSEIRQWKDSL